MPYKRPMPDTLDAKIVVIKKGWIWNDEPFPYPSPGVCANFLHWEDEEGKPHFTPEWESKWWFKLLWELSEWSRKRGTGLGFVLRAMPRFHYWQCYEPGAKGRLSRFHEWHSLENNPGGCVCQAWIAVFGKEADDGD